MSRFRPQISPAAVSVAAALLGLFCACKEEPPKPQGAPAVLASPSGATDVAVTDKGFEPARIQAAAGQLITLRFTRKVENTCADAVLVQGDPVRHVLPLNRAVEVKVTPPASGELAFACPMNMIRGAVVVLPR
jgi:plastocyanin domain-containing protein